MKADSIERKNAAPCDPTTPPAQAAKTKRTQDPAPQDAESNSTNTNSDNQDNDLYHDMPPLIYSDDNENYLYHSMPPLLSEDDFVEMSSASKRKRGGRVRKQTPKAKQASEENPHYTKQPPPSTPAVDSKATGPRLNKHAKKIE
eukprot:g70552.t1